MRNPLPVLAAALLAAAGAFAADLPSWPLQEEPFSAWRIVIFADGAGKGHDLWCKWSECGINTSGTAKLYTYDRQSSEPYTYYEHWYTINGSQSAVGTYSTQLSHYVLDLKTQQATIPGTNKSYETHGQRSFIPTGYLVRVLPPIAMADDVPAPTPPVPTVPGKPTPLPKPKPTVPPTVGKKPPVNKPSTEAGTPLSRPERGWLTPGERSVYDTATAATKSPSSPAALAQAYKDARTAVARNLRPESQTGYQSLVAASTYEKIDAYLANVAHYTGPEVMLSAAERDSLLTVLKSSVAHTDFIYPNAQAEYDSQMKPILTSAGVPALLAHVRANQIVRVFRPMTVAPTTTPGKAPDGSPAMLMEDPDFAKVPVQTDRDALYQKYKDAWGKAVTNDDKNAVNKDFLAQIAALAGATKPGGTNPPATSGHYDFKNTTTTAAFDALPTDADRTALCAMMTSNPTGGVDNCGDILKQGSQAAITCNTLPAGVQKSAATIAAASACMDKINACQGQATAKDAPASTPTGNGGPTDAIRASCRAFALKNGNGNPQQPAIGTGGVNIPDPCSQAAAAPGSAPGANPGGQSATDKDCTPKTDDKKPDPNFTQNLGNGVAAGIGGLLLASFFGGPLLMLAAAVICGAGAYYASKAIDDPKPPKGSGS